MPAPMDVQPAAATEQPGQGPPAGGGAGAVNASAEPAAGSSGFPSFVGHRRPLPPDAELFEAGNAEREELARQVGAR